MANLLSDKTLRKFHQAAERAVPSRNADQGLPPLPPETTDIFIVKIEGTAIPAFDGTNAGMLELKVWWIAIDEDEELTEDDYLKVEVWNISDADSPTDTLALAVREKATGRLILVTGGGDCTCENVIAISTTGGAVTGGSLGLTWTIDGTTGSAVTVNYNDSAATVRTNMITGNSAKLNTTNFIVYDGPVGTGEMYFKFMDDLATTMIPYPTISNSLTGTNVAPRIRRFSAPEFT